MKKTIATVLVALTAAFAYGASDKKEEAPQKAGGAEGVKLEARAQRMIKSAMALIENGEDERGVGMLEAVRRMYPESEARFKASLELGRFQLGKRNFDTAISNLQKAYESYDKELKAESLFLQGQVHAARGAQGEAIMVYRRLAQDFPSSPFANDAYFAIGQSHFEASRWARASEAFELVGTAVPESVQTNDFVLAEAGQRVYAQVTDKDLTILARIGGKAYAVFTAASGDTEKILLKPFGRGDGEFIASVQTTADKTNPNDGRLTVHGSEHVRVTYLDTNREDGSPATELSGDADVVSTGSVGFMDGAMRQRVRGVFGNQPAFIVVKDLDLDTTEQADKAEVTIKVQYRERPEPPPGETVAPPPAPDAPWLTRFEKTISLPETGPRTGVFTGRITVKIAEVVSNELQKIALAEGEIAAAADDRVQLVYEDKKHLMGEEERICTAEAAVLVGGSTDPQSIVAHSSEAGIQAKKLLIEGQLLCKWGRIFKDVGLEESAKSKAEDGLSRIADVMSIGAKHSLDRQILEDAYQAKWDLLIVQGNLGAAIATCNELVRRYPDTLLADRAFMQIAKANMESKDPKAVAQAISVLNAIIQLPTSQLKAEAQFRIAEVAERQAREAYNAKGKHEIGDKPDFSGAIVAYQRCAENYPNSAFAGESFKKMVDYFISIKSYARALETVERVAQDYADAPWLDEILLKWGVVAHRMGDVNTAKQKFHRIMEEYPSGNSATQAKNFLKKIEAQQAAAEEAAE